MRIHQFIETAVDAYVTCGLWATCDDDENPLDKNYGPDDLADSALESVTEDVTAFIACNWRDVKGLDPVQVGHDFLLTRDGHGAGFWDRGLGAVGDRLTMASKPYGESGFYVGEDGLIYV